MLTHIDLFSGIGGFGLAAQWAGFKTVAFVEIDAYAQEVLKQNFGAISIADAERRNGRENDKGQIETERGRIEDACVMADASWHEQGRQEQRAERERTGFCSQPILYGDIQTFNGTMYRGATLLTGGFPCQPFSQAGKRRGKEDDRYLWPEMLRVIHEARPAWVLGENVAGIVTMELDRVLSDLEGEGYAVQSFVIPACAVDAKHRRDRIWIVAHAGCLDSERGSSQRGGPKETGPCDRAPRPSKHAEHVADAESRRQQKQWFSEPDETQWASVECPSENSQWKSLHDTGLRRSEGTGNKISRREQSARWESQSDMGGMAVRLPDGLDDGKRFYAYQKEWESIPRVATGVKNRVDRLKGLGNSIQPQVAYEILKMIAKIENSRA